MNGSLFIDAVGKLDADLVESYYLMDARLHAGLAKKKSRKKKALVTLLVAAMAMLLTCALLITTLPLVYVTNAEKIDRFVSDTVENVLFPLDDESGEVKKEDLLLNWTDWALTRSLFQALGAGTEDSVIDQLKSEHSGLMGEMIHKFGTLLDRMYHYYDKHKDISDQEKETIGDEVDTSPDFDDIPELDGSLGLSYQQIYNNGQKEYAVSGIGDCTDERVVIPTTYRGLPVTAILTNAFYSADIKEIVLHNNVKTVDHGAFSNCKMLERVTLSDSIESMPDNVFKDCTNLSVINFPRVLKSIGANAFYGCKSLSEIQLPYSLEIIKENAFRGCTSLSGVTLPQSLISIGDYAFAECRSINEIELPQDLQIIGYGVFASCERIKQITLPESCTSVGAFASGMTGLEIAIILPQMTEIPDGMFGNCLSLSAIVLPSHEQIIAIGNSAFQNCTSLKRLDDMPNLQSIGDNAFASCLMLTEFKMPSTVQSIGKQAFSNCTSLQEIMIPCSVERIESKTFYKCQSLTRVIFEQGGHKLTWIGNNAFEMCEQLDGVLLPESLAYVGKYAFAKCESMQSIDFPDNVGTIEASAFSGCTALQSVRFGNGLEKLSEYAFEGCDSLKEVQIDKNIKTLEYWAFGLSGLEKIVFGTSIKEIDHAAFNNCNDLKLIEYQGTVMQWKMVSGHNYFPEGLVVKCVDGDYVIE